MPNAMIADFFRTQSGVIFHNLFTMLNLLKELIRADSTSSAGELAGAGIFNDYFKQKNISAILDIWGSRRANLTAHIPSAGVKPALIFGCHLDVVPPGDVQWDYPPFEAVEHDGKIFGRGSSDMKGPMAAAACAVTEVLEENNELKGDVYFIATAGEETDSCGIRRLLEMKTVQPAEAAGVIITEPTDLKMVTAHRGLLWLEITTYGKTAHGSMPQLGINAIEKTNQIINHIREIDLSESFCPFLGSNSLSINGISGGKAPNVVPDRCTMTVDIRTLPNQQPESFIRQFKRLFEKLQRADSNFKADIDILRFAPALRTDEKSEFVTGLLKATDIKEPSPIGFTTDGPYFTPMSQNVVIFGPGKASMCHQPNESIEIADMENAKHLYKKIIRNFVF